MNLFGKEPDLGNIEYKLYINPKKKDKLVSQFFFRMREGSGKAIYLLGIHDSGTLHIKNTKYILYNIIRLTKFFKNKANYKLRIFIKKPYIFSIIKFYNTNIESPDNITDFSIFNH